MLDQDVEDAELVDAPMATDVISPGDTKTATAEGAKEAHIDARIAAARGNLATRLSELERRVDYVKEKVDPRQWIDNPRALQLLSNPWAQVGAAALVGFIIGRSGTIRPLVHTAVGSALSTLIKQAVARIER